MTNVDRTGIIPRIAITEKAVLYQSPIVLTPLFDHDLVDAEKLNKIVQREYKAANIDPAQVATGAVIITGETARKKNADAILRSLAGLAGDFIVSVAGPNLESLISGRGSGRAPLPPDVKLTFHEEPGVHVIESYGQSACTAADTYHGKEQRVLMVIDE